MEVYIKDPFIPETDPCSWVSLGLVHISCMWVQHIFETAAFGNFKNGVAPVTTFVPCEWGHPLENRPCAGSPEQRACADQFQGSQFPMLHPHCIMITL